MSLKNNDNGTMYYYNPIAPYELLVECPLDLEQDLSYSPGYSCCTKVPPPNPKNGYAICWDHDKKSWRYVIDHRGQLYWTEDMTYNDSGIPVTELGPIPEAKTFTRPPIPTNIQRKRVLQKIDTKELQILEQGVTYNGKAYKSDMSSMLEYLIFQNSAEQKEFLRVQLKDGSWTKIDKQMCFDILKLCKYNLKLAKEYRYAKTMQLETYPDHKLESFPL
jgi:hypothetical protein